MSQQHLSVDASVLSADAPAETPPETRSPETGVDATGGTPQRKPQARPRARLRLKSLLMAVLILVVINVGLQVNRRYWDVQSDRVAALLKVQTCESLGRTPDVLYLGSSRTLYGIDPATVDATLATQGDKPVLSCNAGVVGTNFEQDYYTLKRFLEDGFAPKLVIETLWERNINVNAVEPLDNRPYNNAQIVNLADAGDVPDLMQHFGTGPQQWGDAADYLASKLIPLYGDRVGIFRAVCSTSTVGPCSTDMGSLLDPTTQSDLAGMTRLGWAPVTRSMATATPDMYTSNNSLWYRLFTPEVGHFKIGGGEIQWLHKFITLAQAHHVKVALVQTPIHPVYYRFFDHGEADWNTVMAYWQSVASQHGIPFYDGSHLPGFQVQDFDDPHHLNNLGAPIFSRWLATNVVAPLLR